MGKHQFEIGKYLVCSAGRRRRLHTQITHRKHNLRFCSLSPLSTDKLDLSQIGQPAKYVKMEEDEIVRGVASCVHMTCVRVIQLMPLNDQQTAICAHFSLFSVFSISFLFDALMLYGVERRSTPIFSQK